MLKGKSLSEIWVLVKWAINVDAHIAKVDEVAKSNRVLIETVIGIVFISVVTFGMLFFLFFKVS